MRRVLALGLIWLVLLTGCGNNGADLPNAAPSSSLAVSSPESEATVRDDPFIEKLLEAVDTADYSRVWIEMDSISLSEFETLRITRDLLSGIVEALLAGNLVPSKTSLQSVSNCEGTARIQFSYEDNQYVTVELYVKPAENPKQIVLWMQSGASMAQYTCEPSAYEEMHKLLSAQIYPKELLLEGDYIRYLPVNADKSKLPGGLCDVLEVNGKLLFLWNEQDIYRLEAINPQTGEAEIVWEFTEPTEKRRIPPWLEYADYEEYDYRLVAYNRIIYRSSENHDLMQVFTAPQELLDSKCFSYDVNPQTGRIAYSADEGVYVGTADANAFKLLDHQDIPQHMSQEESDPSHWSESYYGEVRLLGDGKYLSATVFNPWSQSFRRAIVVVEIASGEITVFNDVFSAMMSGVHFLDDNTIVALGLERVTIIDVETAQTRILPSDLMARTDDYVSWVKLHQENSGDGIPVGYVVTYQTEAPEEAKRLLRVSGEKAWICALSPSYVVLICEDSRENYIALIAR